MGRYRVKRRLQQKENDYGNESNRKRHEDNRNQHEQENGERTGEAIQFNEHQQKRILQNHPAAVARLRQKANAAREELTHPTQQKKRKAARETRAACPELCLS
jgi:hypothetical protein